MAQNEEKKAVIIESIRNGASNTDAYNAASVPKRTFYNWMKDKEFAEKVNTARASGENIRVVNVEDALYKLAMKGNVTAQIFWLKNRISARWADKQEVKQTGQAQQIVVVRYPKDKEKDGVSSDEKTGRSVVIPD